MTLKEFYEELLKSESVPKEEAEALYNALSAYHDKLKELTSADAPRMRLKDHEDLFNLFSEAYDKSVSMSRKLQDKTPKFLSDSIEQFSDQYTVIKTITDKKEHTTLSYALNQETNKVLVGRLDDRSTVSGNQSDRYVVNGINSKGAVVTGLFTTSKTFKTKEDENYISVADSLNGQTLRLPNQERIDSRNTAMSDVANLLGRDNLLAKSTEMKYIDKETGKEISGTFMKFVDATDHQTISPDKRERYYNVNVEDPLTFQAKKDTLDLTIIDYLCGNIDRHASNIMYKYKKCPDGSIRLNSIVGIDNDCCFGTKDMIDEDPLVRLQALDDTVVISKSMADKLCKITPELLSATLKKNHICQASVDRALERLEKLQTRIEAGRKMSELFSDGQMTEETRKKKAAFLKDPVGTVRSTREEYYKKNKKNPAPFMIILQDEDIDKLNLKSIAKHAGEHPYHHTNGVCSMVCESHTKSYIEQMIKHAESREQKKRKRPPRVKLTTKNISHFCEEMKKYFGAINMPKTTDQEYKSFFESIHETAQACENVIKSGKPNGEQIDRVEKCLEKLQMAGTSYLERDKLVSDKNVSKKEQKQIENQQKRIKFVTDVLEKTGNFVKEFASYKEKFEVSSREEALMAEDRLPITANDKKDKKFSSGTIEAAELDIRFSDVFGSGYANDAAVAEWKADLEKNLGETVKNWGEFATDFDFPAKNEATSEFVLQLQTDCDLLYKNYKNLMKKNPVDIDKWNEKVAPLADNLKINLDQYNQATDFMFFDNPKMHALSGFITAIQNKSEKVADRAFTNLKSNKEINLTDPEAKNFVAVEDNRFEKLRNKLIYYSFNIDQGAEKHSNSKEFLKMKNALLDCANKETLDSEMLDNLSKAAGEYLTKKTQGIHLRSFADPVREFRLDMAKTIKQIADSNLERVKSLPVPEYLRDNKVKLQEKKPQKK